MTKERLWAAVGLVAGAGGWGVLWYPLRLSAARGLGGLWLTTAVFAGAFLIGALSWARHRRAMRRPLVSALLALLGGITNIAFVLAVLQDNVLRVTLLFYLAPVWSLLFARVFLKESINAAALAGVGTALIGTVILLWRHAQPSLHPGDGLALIAGLSFAGANVLLRAAHDLPLETKALVTFAGVAALAGLSLAAHPAPWPTADTGVWVAAVAGGGLGVYLITRLVQYGVSALPVRQSAVLLLFEVIAAAFSQHGLLHRTLGAQAVFGALLIAIGATLVAAFEA